MMAMLTNHVIARAISTVHCAIPWQFGDFYDMFLPNIGNAKKKSFHLSTEPLALCLIVNPALVFALRS